MQSKATTVDAYLAEVPADRRAALERLRALVRRVFPDAEEGIEYGMPVFKQGDDLCAAFANRKDTISIYGLGAEIDRHREALVGADLGKGCVRYRKAAAIDFALIESMLVESRDRKIGDLTSDTDS